MPFELGGMDPRQVPSSQHGGRFRSWVHHLLQISGFVVVGEASNGEQAIKTAERLRSDLILLDIQLSDIDGLRVARCLTAQASAPIVVLTSSRDASDYGLRLHDCDAQGLIPISELSGATLVALLSSNFQNPDNL
jgi:DNA-binding NarL/FixJ family response regulator